jgi:hypothetical protein
VKRQELHEWRFRAGGRVDKPPRYMTELNRSVGLSRAPLPIRLPSPSDTPESGLGLRLKGPSPRVLTSTARSFLERRLHDSELGTVERPASWMRKDWGRRRLQPESPWAISTVDLDRQRVAMVPRFRHPVGRVGGTLHPQLKVSRETTARPSGVAVILPATLSTSVDPSLPRSALRSRYCATRAVSEPESSTPVITPFTFSR